MPSLRQRFRDAVPWRIRIAVTDVVGRTSLARRFLANARDLDALDAELRLLDGRPWEAPRSRHSTRLTTERVVEIPWALSRYRGERRVLDIGPAYALPLYTAWLRSRRIPELHGVDLLRRPVPGFRMTYADVRRMPFADGHFELVYCISTLEHIGRDNTHYEIAPELDPEGDLHALREMTRVLAADGRIIVTVPFGKAQDHRWFVQYDRAAWDRLLARAALRAAEEATFGYVDGEWRRVDPGALAGRAYASGGAVAGAGVLCAALVR